MCKFDANRLNSLGRYYTSWNSQATVELVVNWTRAALGLQTVELPACIEIDVIREHLHNSDVVDKINQMIMTAKPGSIYKKGDFLDRLAALFVLLCLVL